MSEYYVNELSFEGQFTDDTVRRFEREMALIWSMYELLREKGLGFHLSRSVLQQPACISSDGTVKYTISDIVGKIDRGLAHFFWERIGAWSFAAIGEEFDGVRVFFAGKDISDFAPAYPAVLCYLDPSNPQRLISSVTSSTYTANTLDFSILEKNKTVPISVSITNLINKNDVIIDLGDIIAPPCNWRNALNYFKEKYQYIHFTDNLTNRLLAETWSSNLFAQVDGKFQRLNSIVGTVIELRAARKNADQELIEKFIRQYNEQYKDMFAHKNSSFSDESATNKDKYKDDMTFNVAMGRSEFCPFHTKFAYNEFRLHFTWPISDTDYSTYIVHLGPKITM